MHIGPYTAPVQKSAMSIAHSWGAGTFIWHAALAGHWPPQRSLRASCRFRAPSNV